MKTITDKIVRISRNGRYLVGSRDYFSNPKGFDLVIGQTYKLSVVAGEITEVHSTRMVDEICVLHGYITELEGLLEMSGIPFDDSGIKSYYRELEHVGVERAYRQSQTTENAGLKAIARARDTYTGSDGKTYVSAGKTEHYNKLHEVDNTECYGGVD